MADLNNRVLFRAIGFTLLLTIINIKYYGKFWCAIKFIIYFNTTTINLELGLLIFINILPYVFLKNF